MKSLYWLVDVYIAEFGNYMTIIIESITMRVLNQSGVLVCFFVARPDV